MNTRTPNQKLAKLQAQLDDLKTLFEDLISSETEFERLKPIRTQINELEKAIANALNENKNPGLIPGSDQLIKVI